MVTMPSEKDFKSDLKVGTSGMTIGEVCNKYFKASSVASTEEAEELLMREEFEMDRPLSVQIM
ncbi:hypothetical protein D1N68_20840 [Clostridioides difficile]|nr:hypothetical protein D1N68_20840 [Clostridioides difficile]